MRVTSFSCQALGAWVNMAYERAEHAWEDLDRCNSFAWPMRDFASVMCSVGQRIFYFEHMVRTCIRHHLYDDDNNAFVVNSNDESEMMNQHKTSTWSKLEQLMSKTTSLHDQTRSTKLDSWSHKRSNYALNKIRSTQDQTMTTTRNGSPKSTRTSTRETLDHNILNQRAITRWSHHQPSPKLGDPTPTHARELIIANETRSGVAYWICEYWYHGTPPDQGKVNAWSLLDWSIHVQCMTPGEKHLITSQTQDCHSLTTWKLQDSDIIFALPMRDQRTNRYTWSSFT